MRTQHFLAATFLGLVSAFAAAAQVTVPGQVSVPGAMAIPATPGGLNPNVGMGTMAPSQPGIPTVTGTLPSGAVVPSGTTPIGTTPGTLTNPTNNRSSIDPANPANRAIYGSDGSTTDPNNPANGGLYNGTNPMRTTTPANGSLYNSTGTPRTTNPASTTPARRPVRRATTTGPTTTGRPGTTARP